MKPSLKIIGTILVLVVAMVINGVTLELAETRLFGMIALVVAFFAIRAIWKKGASDSVSENEVKTGRVNPSEIKVERFAEEPSGQPEIKKATKPEKTGLPQLSGLESLQDIPLPSMPYDEKTKSSSVEITDLNPPAPVRRPKAKELLPPVAQPEQAATAGPIFVRYDSWHDEPDQKKYPILRIPVKGTVIRSHRLGSTKRRGFKEADFQAAISSLLSSQFTVLGNARINTGKNTRPFEPDIAIIGRGAYNDIRIDVEIDEPYAGITRQATHCIGDDLNRDIYFQDRGWIVLRFAEIQVHQHMGSCLKEIVEAIEICMDLDLPDLSQHPYLERVTAWSVIQAQKWAKANYRESYLNHEFGLIESQPETAIRDLSEQEAAEEEMVKPTAFGEQSTEVAERFNQTNRHVRDCRLKFYPDEHVYTLDGVPIAAVSNVIARFFPEFNAEYWSNRKAAREGMWPEELREKWARRGQESRDLGTKLHEQIEQFFLIREIANSPEFKLFQDYEMDTILLPFRSEWRIYDEEYMIAGTVDLVVAEDGIYDMYDWKRSRKVVDGTGSPITVNRWANGIGPLSHLPDTSFNRYVLQQNIYRILLEKNYGIIIRNMFIVVLHPSYGNYYELEVPRKTDEVMALLKALA
jgi:hypothetical protein